MYRHGLVSVCWCRCSVDHDVGLFGDHGIIEVLLSLVSLVVCVDWFDRALGGVRHLPRQVSTYVGNLSQLARIGERLYTERAHCSTLTSEHLRHAWDRHSGVCIL